MHSADVLHRDLKPSTLLLNASCDLKICDFGLSRTNEAPTKMTEYVVTRWYRAPELLLNAECYTPAIDIWSVGCIIAEMLGRRPAFPGKDYLDELKLIVRALGARSEAEMAFIHHEKAKDYLRTKFATYQARPPRPARWGSEMYAGGGNFIAMRRVRVGLVPVCIPAMGGEGRVQAVDFSKIYKSANPLAIDLMLKMLRFNPADRIDVDGALAHPYLAPLHDAAAEPRAPASIFLGFEDDNLDGQQVRARMFEEIVAHYRK